MCVLPICILIGHCRTQTPHAVSVLAAAGCVYSPFASSLATAGLRLHMPFPCWQRLDVCTPHLHPHWPLQDSDSTCRFRVGSGWMCVLPICILIGHCRTQTPHAVS